MMYDKEELYNYLKQQKFGQVYCQKDWIPFVKNEYKKVTTAFPDSIIMDMRCPKAVQYVKQTARTENLHFPQIEPILIHCAKELAEKYGKSDSLIITTPCKALADYGNALNIHNTTFISWNDFAADNSCQLKKNHLETSPIPPGFFKVLKSTISLTGEDEIKVFFNSENSKSIGIIEMLFCKDGCNNGDGVL